MSLDDLPQFLESQNYLDNYLNDPEIRQLFQEIEQASPQEEPIFLPGKPFYNQQTKFSEDFAHKIFKEMQRRIQSLKEKLQESENQSEDYKAIVKNQNRQINSLGNQLKESKNQSESEREKVKTQERLIRKLVTGLRNSQFQTSQQLRYLEKSLLEKERLIEQRERQVEQLFHHIQMIQSKSSNVHNTIITNYPNPTPHSNSDEIQAIVSIIKKEIDEALVSYPHKHHSELQKVVLKRLREKENFSIRVAKALRNGCKEALEQMLNHPMASFIIGFYEDWSQ